MSLLALVLLVHQPIYVLTQFLIARSRQREVAIVSIVATGANLVLSFVLAWVWDIWGVAVATLVTDIAALAWIAPRLAAPAARDAACGDLARAVARPVLPRPSSPRSWCSWRSPACWQPDTLLIARGRSVRSGLSLPALALWRFGLSGDERGSLRRHSPARPSVAATEGM